jgi:hypothetical protein
VSDPWTTTASSSELPGQAPPVVFWYKLTMAATAVLYLVCAAGSVFALANPNSLANEEMTATEWRTMGAILLAVCAPLGAVYTLPLFLPPSKGAWIFGIVLIAILLSSCCYWPFCIPILIYWLRDDNRAYFGYEVTAAAPRSRPA